MLSTDCAVRTLITNNSFFIKEEVKMFKRNIHFAKNKKTLKVLLVVFRFIYNFFKILTVNFAPVFLLSFIGTMMNVAGKMNKDKHFNTSEVKYVIESLNSVFLYILLILIVLAVCVCIFYELMKYIKDELKKIDRAQSMPKKVGMRYIFR